MHAEEPCGHRTINCGPVFFFFFLELKDVRVFIIIMKIIIMMMMIKKKKKNLLQMLHFHPARRHSSSSLSPAPPALDRRVPASPCVLVQGLSPHSVGTPGVPEQLSLVRREADAAMTLDADTSRNAPRKTAYFSLHPYVAV